MASQVDDNSRTDKRTIGTIQEWVRTEKCTKETNEIATPSTKTQANPISDRKREANRKNARRSTGPKTKTGKSRSRYNAVTHGLLVKKMPLDSWFFWEDGAEAKHLFQKLVDHFQPFGPLEELHVDTIAQCYWKMRRLQIAENASIHVEMQHEFEFILLAQGPSKSSFDLVNEAVKKTETLGYVDDALVKTILEKVFAEECVKSNFRLANQKAKDLATQHADSSDLSGKKAMKEAQSVLRRSLRALRERTWAQEQAHDRMEHRRREPLYAQHLLPSSDVMDNLLRYQTAVERRLYRAIAELERLQRQRLEDAVPAPATLNVNLLSADE
ncbi:MAG: hypothetical protein ACLPVW_09405 [Terriglobales bacterium]